MKKNVPLTLEQFTNFINFIKDRDEAMNKINKLFTNEFEDSIFYPYFRYEAQFVKLLELTMHDNGDYISYFLYELNFGEKWEPGCIIDENDNDIPLGTIVDLYNILVEEY